MSSTQKQPLTAEQIQIANDLISGKINYGSSNSINKVYSNLYQYSQTTNFSKALSDIGVQKVAPSYSTPINNTMLT